MTSHSADTDCLLTIQYFLIVDSGVVLQSGVEHSPAVVGDVISQPNPALPQVERHPQLEREGTHFMIPLLPLQELTALSEES